MEAKEIHALTMDREFGGEKWLEWLDRQGVGYVVRVKQNILINGKAAFRQVITEKGKKKNAESSSTGSVSQFMAQFLSCSVTENRRHPTTLCRSERPHPSLEERFPQRDNCPNRSG